MKLRLFSLLCAFMPLLAFGQGASLTIFSEDGDKFILYLNGQQQNNMGQTNLRLDGLSQPYYQAKIVFEDKSKAAISKNIPVNDPATNEPADVVYKIKNKDEPIPAGNVGTTKPSGDSNKEGFVGSSSSFENAGSLMDSLY
mgnify:CR=1 FL=1